MYIVSPYEITGGRSGVGLRYSDDGDFVYIDYEKSRASRTAFAFLLLLYAVAALYVLCLAAFGKLDGLGGPLALMVLVGSGLVLSTSIKTQVDIRHRQIRQSKILFGVLAYATRTVAINKSHSLKLGMSTRSGTDAHRAVGYLHLCGPYSWPSDVVIMPLATEPSSRQTALLSLGEALSELLAVPLAVKSNE